MTSVSTQGYNATFMETEHVAA
ncbi:hypothetical protein BVI434_670021 [Burkholderia vietnamiensis]|nr:hypothetical protein BVI434_670021 [Burkholderia vietnamiensis]